MLIRILILVAAIAGAQTLQAATFDLEPDAPPATEASGFETKPRNNLRLANAPGSARKNGTPPASFRPFVSPASDVTPLTEPIDETPPDPIPDPMPETMTEAAEIVAAPETTFEEPMPVEDAGVWEEQSYWQGWHEPPAPTCSSGTWFNRGRWYARQDFVYMSRYSTDTRSLIGDYTRIHPQTLIPYEITTTGRSLGFEPGGRITLGRFLCRDQKNRDHSLEFSFFGLFDWQQSNGMTAREENQLYTLIDPYRTPIATGGPQVGGFNAAQQQNFSYSSSFDSYELNYVLSQRLGRDQLELTPEGEWVRNLSPKHISTYFAGVRYIHVGEGFDWTSFAADPTEANGLYEVTTQNHLLGLQFGHEVVIQRKKLRLGIRNKIGSYINYADQNTFVNIVDNRVNTQGDPLTTGDQTRIEKGNAHDMAFIYDLSIMGAYHIRPNLALRAGYEFMFVNQLALAPEQLTFVPPPASRIVTGGTLLYNGFSLGLEMVW